MRVQILTALLAGATAWSHVAAAAENSTVYGPGALSIDVATSFLDCLNTTGTDYRLFVDDGWTVVLPVGNRTIELEATDGALYNCLTMPEIMSGMQVAAEDTTELDEAHHSSILADTASYAWLVAQGAQGKQVVGSRAASSSSSSSSEDDGLARRADGLQKRTHYHYYAYLSDYSSCANEDLYVRFGSTCYNHASAYASVQFDNAFSSKILTMKIWPHHNCSKGNLRQFTVGPNSVSSCHTRTTYSYHGHYKTCSC
ncbi:hypothetical protein BO94DRAFT_549462 [Aspergillus sclerotioniger CBS 115572]|uniref:Uncharacterized protein n=1 Tax=Aspergillus sclerotioniger CBS 115572 TaxID=1450535 RepID=A0A317VQM5_9EURO|nr:hypothetical protein BO94DRAFT_549462 [Aspergillus sclerotioniger CBS 115572]PWY75192.1 hypothetical protein BO94DRAFT_549462 [Aspergillus sclerotioniger CBS 115572]